MRLTALMAAAALALGLTACATTPEAAAQREAALSRAEVAVGAARLAVLVGGILTPETDFTKAAELVTRAEQALALARAANSAAAAIEAERLAASAQAVLPVSPPAADPPPQADHGAPAEPADDIDRGQGGVEGQQPPQDFADRAADGGGQPVEQSRAPAARLRPDAPPAVPQPHPAPNIV